MPLPVGVTSCTVTYGPPLSQSGAPGVFSSVRLRADRTVIHAATGTALFADGETVTPDEDGMVTVEVPHVDQAGFIDEAGNAVTGWSYTLSGFKNFDGVQAQPFRRAFQAVDGEAALDLDLVPAGVSLPAMTAPSPLVGPPGESAYEVAVENGFVGTEEEWLESLASDVPGPGAEFTISETHVQWRHVGDAEWTDLVPLADLKGQPGAPGAGVPTSGIPEIQRNRVPVPAPPAAGGIGAWLTAAETNGQLTTRDDTDTPDAALMSACWLVTATTPSGSVAQSRVIAGLTIGKRYVFSAWRKVATGVNLATNGGKIRAGATASQTVGGAQIGPAVQNRDVWGRTWVAFTAAAASINFYYYGAQTSGEVVRFAGFQVEEGEVPGPFLYGGHVGAEWTGTVDNSESIRRFPSAETVRELGLLGARRIIGQGPPVGAIQAPVLWEYVDAALTRGARLWRKDTAESSAGVVGTWTVIEGDTGWRLLLPGDYAINGWTWTHMFLRRNRDQVEANWQGLSGAAATSSSIMAIPAGFRPLIATNLTDFYLPVVDGSGTVDETHGLQINGSNGTLTLRFQSPGTLANTSIWSSVFWHSPTPWPTALPGTAA